MGYPINQPPEMESEVMSKIDAYETVTNAIIAVMEAGEAKWSSRWATALTGDPRRANGEGYQGINYFLLSMLGHERGYVSSTWMTFKQALDLGGAVRKGEKSAPVIFYKSYERENADGETDTIRMARLYHVFNVCQIDGLPDRFQPEAAKGGATERNPDAEAILRATGANIAEDGGNRAYYRPSTDSIHLPAFDAFLSTDDYLATLAHELCHWTGAKHRLDRNLNNEFGSRDYGAEELVAELGAAFVCNQLGVAGGHIESHASYLTSWIKTMKEDKRAIFRAAAAAQAAANMVLGRTEAKAAAEPKAEPSRETQLIQLRAASPKRGRVEQDTAEDCPLFAATNQPQFDLFAA